MKNILIVCNTHYQLIVALQLKMSIYYNDRMDCIITNYLSNYISVVDNLRRASIFRNVFTVNVKDVKYDGNVAMYKDSVFLATLESDLCNAIKRPDEYKEFLFANLGEFAPRLGRYLKKTQNKIEFSMYEDGLSSYSRIYESRIADIKEPKTVKGIIKKYLIGNVISEISAYYVFNPQLMVWSCPKVKKIPEVYLFTDKLRKTLNTIYCYEDLRDSYTEKVIFFEESYFQDGIYTNDVEMMNRISNKYGIENVFIKTHPRDEVNRFEKLGYKTNIDKSIPWEVIALNIDLSGKVLISMTSTAIANTCIMRLSDALLIYDYRCLDLESNSRLKYTVEVINKMKTIFSELIIEEVSNESCSNCTYEVKQS